ncbi:MAG: tRNA (adenosine(37)-N6)-threonylcarbamoyltransferase complex transferase subunit TsaD [Candidatus Enteromonas sp.]|nr:tRNA (adenosine(37)-N6)-threonylcarbamoyltransferase complex transferase subunit TsaD [Candidatus Enteromonas sp.]MDY6094298.1 tRNA (adenosine(37)-N6)-threonylcarbamoyltransferase complex transferase subunit TsaD [Candidatus Enteromonas sp.]
MPKILAIESSCDETAVAITDDGKLLANVVATQIAVHEKFGGVMPEIASRLHCENITVCLTQALEEAHLKLEDIDAFAVTRGPGLIGCLHVGLQAAKTLAMIYSKPLIPVHHLAGHIYANQYVGDFRFPLLCVVVSGGNTELVIMRDHLDFEIIGETKDDAVGECYDKVARVLGLPYPGGLPIDQHAKNGQHTYDLPVPSSPGGKYDFSYSGLKTSVINLANSLKMKGTPIRIDDMARSFQDVAISMIVDRALLAAKDYSVKQIILAGGVSANSYLRAQMKEKLEGTGIDLIIPPLWCTTDNAAMIAKVAELLYERKIFAPLTLGVDPNWKIDHWNDFSN